MRISFPAAGEQPFYFVDSIIKELYHFKAAQFNKRFHQKAVAA